MTPYKYAMYNAIAIIIGCVKSNMNGRLSAVRRTLPKVRSGVSHSVWSLSLPVSFLRRAAFLWSRMGGYVSWRKKNPET